MGEFLHIAQGAHSEQKGLRSAVGTTLQLIIAQKVRNMGKKH